MADFKLYDHIDILPLNLFIDCFCAKELAVLIIEGSPSQTQLEEAWDNIFCQYVDAVSDSESLYILELKKDISLLEYKIRLIECIVTNLHIVFNEKLLASLQSLGVRTNGIDPNKVDFQLRLRKIIITLGPKRFQLSEMINELEAYEKSIDAKTINRQFFKTVLVRLSRFQGYAIRAHEIVVSEYIALIKDYILSHSKTKEDGSEREDI